MDNNKDLKRFDCPAPYQEFYGYEVFHKVEGRWFVMLIPKDIGKSRTTTSRARYRLSVSLSRLLLPEEHVDHVDGNKINDSLDNLQILSVADNTRKSVVEHGRSAVPVRLVCHICGKTFYRSKRQVTFKVKRGIPVSCSKQCGHKSGKKTLKDKSRPVPQ